MALRILIFIWLASLLARVFLFGEGGEAGAYASVILFWIATAALAGLSIWRLANRRDGDLLPFSLLLTALAAFVYRIVITDGVATPLSSWLFLACVIGLLMVYVKRKINNHKGSMVDA